MMVLPLWKKFCFSHWESQWDCSKIKISIRSEWGLGQEPHWESRTSSTTSSKIKNHIKNLIKNQDLGQDLIEILNEDFFLIENPNENFNEVLSKILIFDEVLDEVLDFWIGTFDTVINDHASKFWSGPVTIYRQAMEKYLNSDQKSFWSEIKPID